jgi:TetR/AcrR family transcriptional regulator, cholesterol catabolism regulator
MTNAERSPGDEADVRPPERDLGSRQADVRRARRQGDHGAADRLERRHPVGEPLPPFGSKLDIVDAILTEFHDHVLAGYRAVVEKESDPIERLRGMTRFAFSLIVDCPAAVLMVQNESKYLSEQARFSYLATEDQTVADMWIDAIDEGIAQGRIRSDIDVRMFYRLVRDAVAGSIRWFKPSKSKTIEDIADEVMDFLLNGILVK